MKIAPHFLWHLPLRKAAPHRLSPRIPQCRPVELAPYFFSSSPSSLVHTPQNSSHNTEGVYGSNLTTSVPSTPGLGSPTPAFLRSYISSIHVSAQLPPVMERLSKATAFIHHFSGVCVFHLLTNAPVIVDHPSFKDCDYGFGADSHYQSW